MRVAALGLILFSVATPAQEEPAPAPEPPTLQYRGNRASRAWVSMPGGTQVAVDEGVEWEGVTVYLSLTWDLVAVESDSGTTLWGHSVGAFWNRIAIVRAENASGEEVWAVELQPGAGARQGVGQRQLYELRTGARIAIPEKAPPGTPFTPRREAGGPDADMGVEFTLLISTRENYALALARLLGGRTVPGLPGPDEVDFDREVVLVRAEGTGWNSRGLVSREAYESDDRILLRIDNRFYQTMGGGDRVTPFGVFVLPRAVKKPYVLERDEQGLIGGPPIWKEIHRFEGLQDPDQELHPIPTSDRPLEEGE
jgi:hypothetical protein